MALLISLFGWACACFAFGRPARLTPVTSTRLAIDADGEGAASVVAHFELSIVVPARNEARTLPTLLGSISRSQLTPMEVIVVDDGSCDATADVARAHGATVIVAPPPPSGWLGKSWACHLGAQRATGTRLLFLDADVSLAPNAIAALYSCHTALGSGLLSVQPTHLPQAPYEHLSAMFNVVAPMGTGAFAVTRPRRIRAAFGPCLFTSVADYRAVGGHQSVRGEVVEDMAMAAHFIDANRPVGVLLGGDLVTFRMYADGFSSLVNGWTKNMAVGALRAHAPSAVAAALWVACLSAVTLSGVVAASAWLFEGTAVPWVVVAAWSAGALQVQLLLRLVGRFHLLTSLLFAIPLLFFVAVFVRSTLCMMLNRPVEWRGRSIVRGIHVSS